MPQNTENVKPNISIHTSRPDFVSAWKHTKGWRSGHLIDLNAVAAQALLRPWSGIIWRDGRRLGDNFLFSDYGAIDCDGRYDLEQAKKDWCDTVSIIMTTKSDSPKCRCFRIIFPWKKRITCPTTYSWNMESLAKESNDEDRVGDCARFFWPGKQIIQIVEDGYFQEVKTPDADYQTPDNKELRFKERFEAMGREGVFPHEIRVFLTGRRDDVEGRRNQLCYRFGRALTYYGMEEEKIIELVSNSKLPLETYNARREAAAACKSGIRKAKKNIDKFKTKISGPVQRDDGQD